MPSVWILTKGLIKKEIIEFKRYLFNTIGGILTIYVIFLLLFFGYKGVSGINIDTGDTLENLVVGFVLWSFLMFSYQDVKCTITEENKKGTLEQLYMSAYPFTLLIIIKSVISMLFNLIFTGIILILTMNTTKVFLNIDIISLMPLLILTGLSILGIGLMLGGLSLIFKKVESYMQIVQFLIVGLVALPVNRFPILRLLPGSLGASMIRKITVHGENILDFSSLEMLQLTGVAILYLTLGCIIYKICESKVMEKGILGHF